MNFLTKLLLASSCSLLVATSFSATHKSVLELEMTYAPYVNLLGSSVGISKTFSVEDIRPVDDSRPWATIGTLGLESNVTGSCSVNFSSTNNFRLRHIINNTLLTNYTLRYKGNRVNRVNTDFVLPSCNETLTNLQIKRRGTFRDNTPDGIYQDIVSIVVTTQ